MTDQAFSLCEEMLTAAGLMMAAMWAHIIWLHHSISKRVDQIAEKLVKDG